MSPDADRHQNLHRFPPKYFFKFRHQPCEGILLDVFNSERMPMHAQCKCKVLTSTRLIRRVQTGLFSHKRTRLIRRVDVNTLRRMHRILSLLNTSVCVSRIPFTRLVTEFEEILWREAVYD